MFRVGAAVRNAAYASGFLKTTRVGVPVLSVGNLTTGGTGKTPVVIDLARRLVERGHTVAVLARGYGAEADGELNDELRLVAREVPEARLHPGRDRIATAREAVADGATVLLLDDGFQHRRLGRDLDLVLLDATGPWGDPSGRMLPRGLLREPPSSLRRADAVILSRVELAEGRDVEALEAAARSAGLNGPALRMKVEPVDVEVLNPKADEEGAGCELRPLSSLQGLPVLIACGIGNPAAFARTAATLGARTSQVVSLPDHHDYSIQDVEALEELASRRAVNHVLVTAKDAVKLAALLTERTPDLTWLSLRIRARLEPEEELCALLNRVVPARDSTPASAAGPETEIAGAAESEANELADATEDPGDGEPRAADPEPVDA